MSIKAILPLAIAWTTAIYLVSGGLVPLAVAELGEPVKGDPDDKVGGRANSIHQPNGAWGARNRRGSYTSRPDNRSLNCCRTFRYWQMHRKQVKPRRHLRRK